LAPDHHLTSQQHLSGRAAGVHSRNLGERPPPSRRENRGGEGDGIDCRAAPHEQRLRVVACGVVAGLARCLRGSARRKHYDCLRGGGTLSSHRRGDIYGGAEKGRATTRVPLRKKARA